MTYELYALAWAGLIWVLHFLLVAMVAHRQLGPRYLFSPRDEQKQLSGVPARLKRAMENYNEGLLLFAVAAVVVHLSGSNSPVTEMCAGIFLGARLLYIPAYALGWSPARSLIWFVGLLATIVMLLAALFG
ncbi:MAG: MAPEG family protein [Minwuia sp.]|uniref:MAPEG family protein n=1 Tax=Minwuia sp. TaxID=2493630 RepID=UPI003A89FA95